MTRLGISRILATMLIYRGLEKQTAYFLSDAYRFQGFRVKHEKDEALLLFDDAAGIRRALLLIEELREREKDNVSLYMQFDCVAAILRDALKPKDVDPDAAYNRVVRGMKKMRRKGSMSPAMRFCFDGLFPEDE